MRNIVLLLCIFVSACSDPKVEVDEYLTSNEGKLTVAMVGNVKISKSELDHTLAFYTSNPMADSNDSNDSKHKVLNQMIEDQVLYNKAIENGFHKSPEYLNNQRKLLAYEYKKHLQNKVGRNAKVSEQDAKRYYNSNIENYQTKAMYRLAIIKNPESKYSAKQLQVKASKLKPHEGFSHLAQYSQHFSSKNKGGLLPWIAENSRLPGIPNALLQKAEALEIGQVKQVKVKQDTYLIRLVSKRDAITKPFKELSYQLQSELLNKQKKKLLALYIEQSKEGIPIDIIEKNVSKPIQANTDKLVPPSFPVR